MRKTVCVSGGGCLYFCGFLHLPKVLMLISWASRKQNGPSDSPLYNALPFTAVLCFLSASVRCSTVKIKVVLDPDLHCSAWPPSYRCLSLLLLQISSMDVLLWPVHCYPVGFGISLGFDDSRVPRVYLQ